MAPTEPNTATQADLRAALAEALEESEFPTQESADADSWESWDGEGAADAPEATLSKEEPADPFASPEAEKVQDELPDEYWGVPLDGIPDEVKAKVIAHFEQQDSTIRKLQERLTTEPDAALASAPAAAAEEVTDEALLAALGFDPEDWQTQQFAPRILPLARTVLDLEDKVDQLVSTETTRQVESAWNNQLNELEEVHGKLPFDRVQVLRYAIEENIGSPYEAYFRLSAPIKREVESVVSQARRDALRKAESGGVKPRSSSGDSPVIDPTKVTLREATRMAMAEAEAETGLSFKNLFGRKVKTEG